MELKLEISDKVAKEVKESGIEWSVLVKRLVKQLKEEKEMIDWSVKLQRASRKGRFNELKKKGVI